MKRSTRPWRRATLLILLACFLSGLTACAPKIQVVPDSREIIDLSAGSEPRPGWYGISAGYLREIYRDCGRGEK